jgi:hypothetical protein
MPRKNLPKLWETNLLWGFVGLFCFALGIFCSVVTTIMRDIRPLLFWIVLPAFAISISGIIYLLARTLWKRVSLITAMLAVLIPGIWWLYGYVPQEVPMDMEKTHKINNTMGFHDQFTPGECHSNVPEVSQQKQWTWFLNGARFGCLSNAYESEGTIDFEPKADETVDTHTMFPVIAPTTPVIVQIDWRSTRNDGNVKWVLSTACGRSGDLNFVFKEVLTIISPRDGSTGEFQPDPLCAYSDALYIRLTRRGSDKDDTLSSTARLTGFSLNSKKDLLGF